MPTVAEQLPHPDTLVHPQQPVLTWGDVRTPWAEVRERGPIWLSNAFPPEVGPEEAKHDFLGHKLISPIIIAAGPASGRKWTKFYFDMGFGGVIEKTRRSVERESNPAPNIAFVKSDEQLTGTLLHPDRRVASLNPEDWLRYKSMTNSFGNPSSYMDVWGPELSMQAQDARPGQLFMCSVTPTILEDKYRISKIYDVTTLEDRYLPRNPFEGSEYFLNLVEVGMDAVIAASVAISHGAKGVELNFACPNVTENKQEGMMYRDRFLVRYTASQIKRRFPNIPVGFKFGDYSDKVFMALVLREAGQYLDFISGINAISSYIEDENGGEILPGRPTSGVCGRIVRDKALRHIDWAAQIREEQKLKHLYILGGGGVESYEDVDDYLNAGADAVQIGSLPIADPLVAYKRRYYKQAA